MQDLAPPTPHEDAYSGPDGLKLGPDGNYYIAQNGSGRVLVVNDDKKLVRMVTVPHLCDQYEFRRGRGGYRVHHRRF